MGEGARPQDGRSWADRAAEAEKAVATRHLRRMARFMVGTRLGTIAWPAPLAPRLWHYWWQAHLLDCMVDAEQRSPSPHRASEIRSLVRGIRFRNRLKWINEYFDDIAWLGLAVQRCGPLAGRDGRPASAAITTQLRLGWSADAGGGIWWRMHDDFKNVPANGPAAILLARTGDRGLAARMVDWMTDHLVDPDNGLLWDGLHVWPDGSVRKIEKTIYSYCQGVYLGACVELASADPDPRWAQRAAAVLDAVTKHLATPDGVLPGGGGGDGGLFAGILARYLADTALRRPELRAQASRLVLASANAAWGGRVAGPGGPLFAADWATPAVLPLLVPDAPERDLSVQLSAWMLLEAAARLERDGGLGARE